MNLNLVLTTVIFCIVVQEVYAERLPSDTKILMDTCYDVLPNCKNHYFPARSKDLKRWCCIRIVDEHEDVNGVEKKKNSHIALTTSPLTSTTKKHKKTKSKKSDGTREKNKKKAKKSEKSSKSKTSKLKEKDKHLMPTITSGSRWTTILTEITKHDRTVSPKHDNIKHMSTTKDNLIPTTPSYFSLPKHTHISDHHKEESSSNIRAVSSGKTTSVTIMKVPMTTRFQSNSTQTTKSSTTLTPSTQSVSSTVSSLNQDVNTTTINLSVISKSRFKMTTPEKTEQPISSSIHTESDYKRTSLNPKTTLSLVEEEIEVTESKRPLTATSTLSPTTKEVTLIEGSSESNTDETPTISVTTNEPTTKSIYSIKSSSKLISSLSRIATTPTTSSRPSTTTSKLIMKPRHWEHFESSEEETGEESTTLTTQKRTIETKSLTTKSATFPTSSSSSSSSPLKESEIPLNMNFEDIPGKSASGRQFDYSSEKNEPEAESPSSISSTPLKVESSSSSTLSVEKDLESIELSGKPLNPKAASNEELETIAETSNSVTSAPVKTMSSFTSSVATEATETLPATISNVPLTSSVVSRPEVTLVPKPSSSSAQSENITSAIGSQSSASFTETLPATISSVRLLSSSVVSRPEVTLVPKPSSSSAQSDNIASAIGSQSSASFTETLPATISSVRLLSSSVVSRPEVTLVPKPFSSSAQSENITSAIGSQSSASFTETLPATISSVRLLSSSVVSRPEVTLVPKPSSSSAQSDNIASTIKSASFKDTLPATISVISPSEVTLVPKPSSSSAQSDNIASTIKSASFKETLKTTISIISPPEVTLVPKPSLSVDQSVNIASTIESLSTASFTTIKPTSLFTFSAAKEDLKSEDVTANKPTNSIKTIKDSTIDTTIKSTPITLRTFTFSTERMNSTIVNLMESSMLNKETTLPTESLPPKELKSRQSTQSLVPSTIVATKLKVQKSTRAPRTTTIEILDVSTDENGESNEEPVIEEEKKEKKDSLIHALLFNGSQRKKPRKLLRAQLGLKVLGR